MEHAVIMIGSVVAIALSIIKLLDSSNNSEKLLWGAVFAIALSVLSLHITNMQTATSNHTEHSK